MIARVVIGANFGDEGKGLVTDYLANQGAGMVVRFNGGANAGHTVVLPSGERHVFHHLGSGTLCGVPTFLSQFFVCNPLIFMTELKQLNTIEGFGPTIEAPRVYAHPDCLVTTFMDILINRHRETARGDKRHGSCGIGLHETMNRSQVPKLKITMSDLWNGATRLEEQLEEICSKYSLFRTGKEYDNPEGIPTFIQLCRDFSQIVRPLGIAQCKDPIFEGSQGLLLDQNNKQYFPHVTHSNTGMKNVEVLCKQAGVTKKDIYYVSRTYLTRHGAGRLPGEDKRMSFKDDTNGDNPWQGPFRFAPLDSGLEERCRKDAGSNNYKIVLTHCDQLAPSNHNAALYGYGPSRTQVWTSHFNVPSSVSGAKSVAKNCPT